MFGQRIVKSPCSLPYKSMWRRRSSFSFSNIGVFAGFRRSKVLNMSRIRMEDAELLGGVDYFSYIRIVNL